MKKVLFLGIAAVGLSFFTTSCSDTYKCKYPLLPSQEYDGADYTDKELDDLEKSCEASGGNWKEA